MSTAVNVSQFTPKNVRVHAVELEPLAFEAMIEGFLESRRNGQFGANLATTGKDTIRSYS